MSNPSESQRFQGKCKWFKSEKGWGFIISDQVTGDIFVHKSEIKSSGPRSLADGESVEFDLVVDDQNRRRANNVTGPGGAPLLGCESTQTFPKESETLNGSVDLWNYYQYYWPQYSYAYGQNYAQMYGGGTAQQRYNQQVQLQQQQTDGTTTTSTSSSTTSPYQAPLPNGSAYPMVPAQPPMPAQPPVPAQPPMPAQPPAQPPQPSAPAQIVPPTYPATTYPTTYPATTTQAGYPPFSAIPNGSTSIQAAQPGSQHGYYPVGAASGGVPYTTNGAASGSVNGSMAYQSQPTKTNQYQSYPPGGPPVVTVGGTRAPNGPPSGPPNGPSGGPLGGPPSGTSAQYGYSAPTSTISQTQTYQEESKAPSSYGQGQQLLQQQQPPQQPPPQPQQPPPQQQQPPPQQPQQQQQMWYPQSQPVGPPQMPSSSNTNNQRGTMTGGHAGGHAAYSRQSPQGKRKIDEASHVGDTKRSKVY